MNKWFNLYRYRYKFYSIKLLNEVTSNSKSKEMKEYSQVYNHDMNGNDIEW